MRLVATLLLLLLAAPALAQTPGNCEQGRAERYLDVSDVRTALFNTGSIAYGNSTTDGDGYLVPAHTGKSPLFNASIWVGGMVDGDLRVAGSTYDRFEFWPGPLEQGATLPNPNDCSDYDRIWVVSTETIAHYEQTGYAAPDLAEWPVELGAEVIDGDGIEGNYDLAAGDRPRVYGSQTAFWVMNDVGNTHRKSLTDPVGLEVQVTAFSIASEEAAFDQATFYRYRLVNRNDQPFEDAYFAYFTDPDLGDATDDLVGVDTTRGLGFVYNDDATDASYGTAPAFGMDFLDGLGAFMYSIGGVSYPLLDPANGEEVYAWMQGQWADGTPMTEGGNGYQTDGDTTTFAFPGDPVTGTGWNELSGGHSGGDRHSVPTSPSFTLAPGEAKDVWLGFVFGQGEDHLDSITELRAASDAVQAAFDSGALFETATYDPPVTLAAPELLSPPDGAHLTEKEPLAWTDVAGADFYRAQVATTPDFSDRRTYFPQGPSLTGYVGALPANEVLTVHWRVRAEEETGGVSPYSEPRSFVYYRYEFDAFGLGTGIVETTHPDVGDPCADDPTDPGCAEGYPGNTVWLHPNATGDYVLTNTTNRLSQLLDYATGIEGESFEVRFTEDCATAGNCLGVHSSAIPGGSDLIASVPFELWFTGPTVDGEDDPSDDERMIPFLRAYPDMEPSADWMDTFPAMQDVISDRDTLTLPVTHRVLGLMPDRAGGYELFQQAAQDFGGPGATYDPETDGDTQIDINPSTGEPCLRQGYYMDFCWRGGSPLLVAPVGGINGFVLADLAGDGTTPEAGTTIRFHANEVLVVDAEDDGPASPAAFGIQAAYPNPFRAEATVAYRLGEPGDVRLAVFDVLGRRVVVLAEGPQTAGEHRTRFEAGGLASGLYLVVLEAGGERRTRKLLLVR